MASQCSYRPAPGAAPDILRYFAKLAAILVAIFLAISFNLSWFSGAPAMPLFAGPQAGLSLTELCFDFVSRCRPSALSHAAPAALEVSPASICTLTFSATCSISLPTFVALAELAPPN